MALSRALARPLIAGMFIAGGLDAARHPDAKVERAKSVTDSLVPGADTAQLVRLNGAVQVVAGSLFALGRFPRVMALVLAGSLVPTTVAGHPFWDEDDPGQAANQRTHFLKNLSMLGGLLLAALDTEGRPSLGWRAKQVAGNVHLPSVSLPTMPDLGSVSLPSLPGHG